MDALEPRLSVVICTRNRGVRIVETLKSVLANQHPSFEVIVIDQSTNRASEDACLEFKDDGRLCYIRSDSVGTGRSRNIGLQMARGEIVAYTDDDCVVPEDWLSCIEQPFRACPTVAVVFCVVKAADHDRTAGFIPEYLISQSSLITSLSLKNRARGIGAGMAVRRDMVCSMGGFDDFLGPGCEDGDVAVRALIRGHHVFETSGTYCVHFGFRTWQEGRSLARRNWSSVGAAYSKPLKTGHWGILRVLLYEGVYVAVGGAVLAMVKLKRPRGLKNVLFLLDGLWQGLRAPVDKTTLRFRDQPLRGT